MGSQMTLSSTTRHIITALLVTVAGFMLMLGSFSHTTARPFGSQESPAPATPMVFDHVSDPSPSPSPLASPVEQPSTAHLVVLIVIFVIVIAVCVVAVLVLREVFSFHLPSWLVARWRGGTARHVHQASGDSSASVQAVVDRPASAHAGDIVMALDTRPPADTVTACWMACEEFGAHHGLSKRNRELTGAYARRLSEAFPAVADDIDRLAQLYHCVRFAPHAPHITKDMARQAAQCLEAIENTHGGAQ